MSGLLFLFFFAFYLSGLSGTVPSYRDSGDLIASIHTLGIAHPPGYALYVLLGKLFVTLLPFGNVAYRVNVFSAFCGAAAAAVLLNVLYRFFGMQRVGALAVTVLFAASPAVVALSRVAEMYTLAASLAGIVLFGLFSDHPKGMSWAALFLGLGLSVHPTLIFLAPLFLIPRPENARVMERAHPLLGHAGVPLLFFLLGLSVFLYLPIRAAQHPLLNWGDPSSWRNFWRVVTRADYGGLKLHPEQSSFSWTADSIAAQLTYFVTQMRGEWGWGALLLGMVGAGIGVKQPATRGRTAGLLMAWFLAGPGFFLLSNLPLHEPTTPAILQPYLLLAGLLWAPFVMYGFMALTSGRKQALVVSMLLLGMLFIPRSWASNSGRNDFYTYDYARNIVRSLPLNAVLYDPDDPTHFSIQVLQTVHHKRTDVVLLNFFRTRWGYERIKRRWPDLLPPVPVNTGQELQRLLWTYSVYQRPFYAELPQKLGPIPYHAEGLVYAAQVGTSLTPSILSQKRAEALLQIYVQRGDYVSAHHRDFFTRHLIDYYADAHCNLGLEYAKAKDWDKAVGHYMAALAIDPELSAAYNDWGIVAFERKDYSRASELFQKGLAFDPQNPNLQKNAELALQKMRKLI